MGTQETQEAVMERDMKTAEFIFLAQEMVECSTVSDLTALGIRIGKDALHAFFLAAEVCQDTAAEEPPF